MSWGCKGTIVFMPKDGAHLEKPQSNNRMSIRRDEGANLFSLIVDSPNDAASHYVVCRRIIRRLTPCTDWRKNAINQYCYILPLMYALVRWWLCSGTDRIFVVVCINRWREFSNCDAYYSILPQWCIQVKAFFFCTFFLNKYCTDIV